MDFLTIYIREAHASDEWPLGDAVTIKQPQSIEERIQVAMRLVEEYDYKIPVLVDSMDDAFNVEYAAWPERYYFFKEGKLISACSPTTEYGYDRLGLRRKLRELLGYTRENQPDLLSSDYLVYSEEHIYTKDDPLGKSLVLEDLSAEELPVVVGATVA